MRWILLVVAFVCCSVAVHAEEKYRRLLLAGEWAAQEIENNGVQTCEVAATASDASHQSLASFRVSATSDRPTTIQLAISISDVKITAFPIPVFAFQFDGKDKQIIPAIVEGKGFVSRLNSLALVPWMHAFTAGQKMSIFIQSYESGPFLFSLSGTTAAINAMSDCTKRAGFKSLPLPFTPGDFAAIPAVTPPPFPGPKEIPANLLSDLRSEGDPQDIPACDDRDAIADIRALLESSNGVYYLGNKLLDIGPIKRQKTASGLMVCSLIVVTARGDFSYLAYYYRKYGKIYLQTVRW